MSGCWSIRDGKLNLVRLSYIDQRFYISGAYIQVMSYLSRAGITRSDVNFFNLGALG